MQNKSQNPDSSKTVLTITVGFLVIYLITGWQWTFVTSVLIGIAGVLSGRLSEKIHWIWMKFAWILSFIIPNVLLTLIYYMILVPIAFLSKIFRKDQPVVLKNRQDSFFRDMNKTFGKEDFKNPW